MNSFVRTTILLALVLAGPANAQTPARRGDGTRAIMGIVIDHNGRPLAGRLVFIHKVGGAPERPVQMETDEAGEFSFTVPATGVYEVFMLDADGEDRFYRPGEFVTLRLKKGGVITGTVTDATGEPIIAAAVQVTRVRDENGRRVKSFTLLPHSRQPERLTDDRGVYRFWGLPAGSYIVSAGGKRMSRRSSVPGPLDDGPPTYHPSATSADAAVEVRLQGGQEVTGIDIRYRAESGHAISGYISGQVVDQTGRLNASVLLIQATTGAILEGRSLPQGDGAQGFIFEDVTDGEYYLMALRAGGPRIEAASPSQRVVVRGQDITGVELKLQPLGSAEGRLVLVTMPDPGCGPKSTASLGEAVVIFHEEGADLRLPNFTTFMSNADDALGVTDKAGAFTIGSLKAGRYRVETRLPSKDWYVNSMTSPGRAQSKPADVARDGLMVRAGERVTNLTIEIRKGAASLGGRLAPPQGSAVPATGLRVHIVPAEPEQKDNVLRFAETDVDSQGSFRLRNLAPGRYWLLARPAGDAGGDSLPFLAWDREARAKLVREAAAASNSVELKPCQQVADRVLSYSPPATKEPR